MEYHLGMLGIHLEHEHQFGSIINRRAATRGAAIVAVVGIIGVAEVIRSNPPHETDATKITTISIIDTKVTTQSLSERVHAWDQALPENSEIVIPLSSEQRALDKALERIIVIKSLKT